REARAVVVALVVHEDLGLVLEPAERARVDDAVAVALERHAEGVLGLRVPAAARVAAPHGVRGERGGLPRFEVGPARHAVPYLAPPTAAVKDARPVAGADPRVLLARSGHGALAVHALRLLLHLSRPQLHGPLEPLRRRAAHDGGVRLDEDHHGR